MVRDHVPVWLLQGTTAIECAGLPLERWRNMLRKTYVSALMALAAMTLARPAAPQ